MPREYVREDMRNKARETFLQRSHPILRPLQAFFARQQAWKLVCLDIGDLLKHFYDSFTLPLSSRNGQVDPSIKYGVQLDPGSPDASFNVDDSLTGIRSWARTGCDSSGANCRE